MKLIATFPSRATWAWEKVLLHTAVLTIHLVRRSSQTQKED
jgi:hypothetical protein